MPLSGARWTYTMQLCCIVYVGMLHENDCMQLVLHRVWCLEGRNFCILAEDSGNLPFTLICDLSHFGKHLAKMDLNRH